MIQDARLRTAFRSCFVPICTIALSINSLVSINSLAVGADVAGQRMRSKRPDRGTYQPPVLDVSKLRPVTIDAIEPDGGQRTEIGLVDAPLIDPRRQVDAPSQPEQLPPPVVRSEPSNPSDAAAVKQASYNGAADRVAVDQAHQHSVATCSCESCSAGVVNGPMHFQQPVFDQSCDASPYFSGDGGSMCCDGSGCDSIGCGNCGRISPLGKRLFGSIELMLMFRKGDLLPPLASDGALDEPGVSTFAGGETVFKDMTAGGRLTIGSWLDNYKDRSLVGRGWFAGEKDYGFSANQDSHPVLTRPFFNVTDGVTPAQDTQVIATPGRANGELHISGSSNVYGADISVRQLWHKQHGATVDLLYGYQYMRVEESLAIASRSTSLNDDFAPVGSVIAVRDSFDVQNDFNGGQIGIASHYREGCWSFSSLAKMGFGSIRRKAALQGNTLTSIDGNNASSPDGLLVRSTNSGSTSDNTFAWAPELDLTLGWQRFPSFDVTFGYHLMAVTDALQVAGTIDPELASNLANPPTGAQRPSRTFNYETFYVHGIHFGLAYIY